jgi:hypothetical protein
MAVSKSRNWTGAANDRYVEIDPISDFAATVRFRRFAGLGFAPYQTVADTS